MLILLKLIYVFIPAVITLALVVALIELGYLGLLGPLVVSVLLLSSIPVFVLLLLVNLLLLVSPIVLRIILLILVLNPLILILVHLVALIVLNVWASIFKSRSVPLHIFR